MGESGCIRVRDEDFAEDLAPGVRLTAVATVGDDFERLGMRVDTDRGASVWVYNNGDDLRVTTVDPGFREIPS